MKSLPFGGFDLSPLLFILKSNCLLEFPTGTSNAGTLNWKKNNIEFAYLIIKRINSSALL